MLRQLPVRVLEFAAQVASPAGEQARIASQQAQELSAVPAARLVVSQERVQEQRVPVRQALAQ